MYAAAQVPQKGRHVGLPPKSSKNEDSPSGVATSCEKVSGSTTRIVNTLEIHSAGIQRDT